MTRLARARVVLVRHGRPRDGATVLPTRDADLDELGREQAGLVADRLVPLGPVALYSSPMVRAIETARPLATLLGIEPEIVPDLREIDFGLLKGMTRDEIERRHPEVVDWTTSPSNVTFPEGESVRSTSDRAVEAVRTIARSHPDETAIAVCHGVVIRTVLAAVLEMPLDAIFRFDVPYGSVSVIDWYGDRPLVRSINGWL